MDWLIGSAAAFGAGLLGAMGLGGGSILLLFLGRIGIGQRAAQGINLLFILPIGLAGLLCHRKNGFVEAKPALRLLPGGFLGLLLGTAAAGWLPEKALTRLFGGFVLLIACRELYTAVRMLFKR